MLQNTSNTQKLSGFPKKFDTNVCASDASMTYLMGKSPFPALDGFVETVASHENVSGAIMVKTFFFLKIIFFSVKELSTYLFI